MPERCRVCSHPDREKISKELLEGGSIQALMVKYGLGKSSLDRHKANHLVVHSQAVNEARNAQTIVRFASKLYDQADGVLGKAEALLDTVLLDDGASCEACGRQGGDPKTAARVLLAVSSSLREVRSSVELLARLVVSEPDDDQRLRNVELDAQLTLAVSRLALPALGAGHEVEAEVVEAELVT